MLVVDNPWWMCSAWLACWVCSIVQYFCRIVLTQRQTVRHTAAYTRRQVRGSPRRGSMSTSFVLNGKNVTLDADPTMPVLWAIRESVGLHGTKFVCGMAQCGACTVHLEGEATRSCVLPLAAVAGKRITTIEGIASRPARAVQSAWGRL